MNDELSAVMAKIGLDIANISPDLLAEMKRRDELSRARTWESAQDAVYLMVADWREHRRSGECDDGACPGNEIITWAQSASEQEMAIVIAAAVSVLSEFLPDNIEAQCAAALARDELAERGEDPAESVLREAGSGTALVVPVDRSTIHDGR